MGEARRLVAHSGLGVSHDEIARAAEVGVGTVYRRFPRKEVLLEELFAAQLDTVAELAEGAAAHDSAWDGLCEFLEHVLRMQAADRGLRELLNGSAHAPALARRARERIAPLVGAVLRRAQDEGDVRADVEVTDVALIPLMTSAVVAPGGLDAGRRALALLLAGLRRVPDDQPPLPASALSPARLDAVLGGEPTLPS
nr:TetR/AcrR family transcriptional regulator [Motilibacter aurantiacus]